MTRSPKNLNKIMVLGTGGVDEKGSLYLTELGRQRAIRAAEAYFDSEFPRSVDGNLLVSGGYSPAVFEEAPQGSEAKLIADFLVREFMISSKKILLEEESTSTEENFSKSKQLYPDFFGEIEENREKLGLVSHESHLERAVVIGGYILGCMDFSIVKLPVRQVISSGTSETTGQDPVIPPEIYIRLAADK